MLEQSLYLDWNNSFEVLDKAYESGLFVLIIGPKGTGKTSLVREFAAKKGAKLESINFSLRTRESHLVGSKTLANGSIGFDEGILVKSMKEGDMLYLDEINAAEADVLLRLDEALDDRRQLVLKESGGELIQANKDWFVVATINPLSHVGTKELPPQILSRFPVRIRLEYPPEEIELQIIKKYISGSHDNELLQGIKLANSLRQAAAVEELYYSPSLRETIAFGKMLDAGVKPRHVADIVFANVYSQWGNIEYQKVSDIITSMFGN
ncbi:MAG: ATP-binding protein [Nitrosopumilaceae archaeon]